MREARRHTTISGKRFGKPMTSAVRSANSGPLFNCNPIFRKRKAHSVLYCSARATWTTPSHPSSVSCNSNRKMPMLTTILVSPACSSETQTLPFPNFKPLYACGLKTRAIRPIWASPIFRRRISTRPPHNFNRHSRIRRGIRLQPNFGGAHTTLAAVLRQLGDNEGAAAESKKGTEIGKEKTNQQAALFATNSGKRLLTVGDLEGAIAQFRSAIQALPSYAPAHFQLGLALQRKGDKAESTLELQKARELDPRLTPPS